MLRGVLEYYWRLLTLPYRVLREEWQSIKQSIIDPDPWDYDEDDDPLVAD